MLAFEGSRCFCFLFFLSFVFRFFNLSLVNLNLTPLKKKYCVNNVQIWKKGRQNLGLKLSQRGPGQARVCSAGPYKGSWNRQVSACLLANWERTRLQGRDQSCSHPCQLSSFICSFSALSLSFLVLSPVSLPDSFVGESRQ